MKKAFTISEVMVTLAVIGVLSAVLSPMISNIIPDKNKSRVINHYKNIVSITNDLIEDENIYTKTYEKDSGKAFPRQTCFALDCTAVPLIEPYKSSPEYYSGNGKYQNLLKEAMKLSLNNKLPDGTTFNFSSNSTEYTITVDVDPTSNGQDAYYGQNGCRKPDRYVFLVVKNTGEVKAGDPLTRAYLLNITGTRKQDDYKWARTHLDAGDWETAPWKAGTTTGTDNDEGEE